MQKMKTTELPKMISTQMEESIFKGDLKEGEKLPSEQQLAEQAGVGRRAIREALKILEYKGLIETRKGAGSFVTRRNLDHFMNMLTDNVQAYISNKTAQLKNVMELRQLIEDYALSCLPQKPTENLLSTLEKSLTQQEKGYVDIDTQLYYEAHSLFHLCIIEFLENPIITMVYNNILILTQKHMRTVSGDHNVMRKAIDEHRAIFEAIKAKNTEESRRILGEHLRCALERFQALTPK